MPIAFQTLPNNGNQAGLRYIHLPSAECCFHRCCAGDVYRYPVYDSLREASEMQYDMKQSGVVLRMLDERFKRDSVLHGSWLGKLPNTGRCVKAGQNLM